MYLSIWAKRWNIPVEAIDELKLHLRIQVPEDAAVMNPDLSEADVLSRVRLEASKKNCRLWRNNVGAFQNPEGSFIRFGLANESSRMNGQIKSADLIGIRPIIITAEMTGHVIGQFVSREIKTSNWKYTGTDREKAQLRWAQLIVSLGGDASFATGEGTL